MGIQILYGYKIWTGIRAVFVFNLTALHWEHYYNIYEVWQQEIIFLALSLEQLLLNF